MTDQGPRVLSDKREPVGEREEFLAALGTITGYLETHTGGTGTDIETALPEILALGRGDWGILYTWDSRVGALTPRVSHQGPPEILGVPVTQGVGLVGRAMARRTGEVAAQVAPATLVQSPVVTGAQMLLVEPVQWQEAVLGVLALARVDGPPFGPREQVVLRLCAERLAMLLEVERRGVEWAAERQEREEAEARLLRRTRQLEAAGDVGHEASRELDTDGILALVARRAIGLVDGVGAAVYVPDPEAEGREAFVARAAQGILRRCMLDRCLSGEGLVGTVAATQAGVVVNDYLQSPYVLPSVLEPVRVSAAVAEPLLFRRRLVGVLEVVRDASGGTFDEEDAQAVRLFARHAALVLDHSAVVTELKNVYSQLQVLQADGVQADRLQMLGQVLSGIVYQLSESLSVIMGQVEAAGVLCDQHPELRESLGLMFEAASTGVTLIRNLKAFTERPDGSNGFEPVDLASVIMQAAAITKPRWRDELDLQGRRVDVEVSIPELPAVLGRAAELRDVFARLILHGLETMPHGGRISISARDDGTHGDDGDPWILVLVRDTGIGVPKAIQTHLFDPTIAGRPRLVRRGIGLSTVGEIIRAHGGTISASGAFMEGTTITVRLRGSRERVKVPEPERERLLQPVVGRRVLVVDDHPSVLRTYEAMLKDTGQAVRTAECGEAALKVLAEGPVDIVLTDLGMPGMSGWQLAQAVKATYPQIRVVLLTGWGEQALREETVLNVFVDRVLFKPASRTKLLQVIGELTT